MAETKPEGEKAAKRKKVNKLSAAEIDAKLNELKTSQGGLRSRYARELLLRKKAIGR
jgi:ribosomal protein L29